MRKGLLLKCFLLVTVSLGFQVKMLAQANHVVISQVYGGGGNAGATYTHDFIELFNPTGVAVSLSGWSLQYQSGAGVGQWQITNLAGSILPGQYFLISLASGSSGNAIPPADISGSINLSATSGNVAVLNTITRLNDQLGKPYNCFNCGIIDLVGYGTGGSAEGSSNAPSPSSATSIFRASNGCVDADNNSTDFTSATASARNSASAASYCNATKLSIPLPPDQIAGVGFSVTITALDAGNNAKNVIANTIVTLTTNANAGTISGTTTATILTGTNSCTFSNVTLSSAGAGATLTATASGGDALSATTSGNFAVSAGAITTYYSNASGYLNEESTWGTSVNGTGSQPANFTSGNQVFHILNNATPTVNSNWTVSGANSKIIVGNGTNACNFTIPDAKTVDGLLQLSPQATLTNSGGSLLSLGIIASTSTVVYNQPNAQPITPATYGNLILSGSGSKTMAGSLTVSGLMSINSGINLVIGSGSQLTLSGTLINAGGIDGTINSSLILNSTTGIILNLTATSFKNVSVEAANTIVLNGTLNLNGFLDIKGTLDAGVAEHVVRNEGNGSISIAGKFITRDADGFSGTNASIPGINPQLQTGCVIEYGRAGNQVVNYRVDYQNITFSNSGIKTLTSGFNPAGSVTIKDNAIVDASNYTFADGGTLNMTGGRLKVGGAGNKPDMTSYNLTNSVIEFSGTSASSIRVSPTYSNIEISGSNVTNSTSGSLDMIVGSTFTVKNGGTYKIINLNGFTGASNTAVSSTNNPAITLETGSTIEYKAVAGIQGITGRTDYCNLILSDAAPKTMTGSPVISGNIIVSGGTITGPQAITFNGVIGTQKIAGLNFNNITFLNNSVKQISGNASVSFNGILSLSAGTLDLNNNKITLKAGTGSDYPKTATVGKVGSGASITYGVSGAFIVERYIPALRRYRFISPSVNAPGTIKQNWMEAQNNPSTNYSSYQNSLPGFGTQITGKGGSTKGFDETLTNNPSLFTFKNADQQWRDVQNADSAGLTAGTAWRLFLRGSRSTDLNSNSAAPSPTILRTTGTLATGTFTFSSILNSANGAYSFIGNPYASAVRWNDLDKVGLKDEYSVIDPTLSNGTGGVYVTWNNALQRTNVSSSKVDGNLQPGQAFFVVATGSTSTPSLIFNEDDKSLVSHTEVFRPAQERTTLSVQLLLGRGVESENIADGLVAVFDDEFTSAIDKEDSYKITNVNESIAIDHNGKILSMEGLPSVGASDTLQLKIWKYRQNNYYLKITGKNFEPSATAFVNDAFLQQETAVDLTSTTIFPFEITDDPHSSAADRFAIVFKHSSLLAAGIPDLKAYAKDKGVQVGWTIQTEANVEMYEVEKSLNGQKFDKTVTVFPSGINPSGNSYGWFDSFTNQGHNYYRLKIIDKSGEIKYSNILMFNVAGSNGVLSIYPNPVKGNVIKLKLRNIEKGSYKLVLFNVQGQMLYASVIEHVGSLADYNIAIGRPVSRGTYMLQISKGEVFISETIIFE